MRPSVALRPLWTLAALETLATDFSWLTSGTEDGLLLKHFDIVGVGPNLGDQLFDKRVLARVTARDRGGTAGHLTDFLGGAGTGVRVGVVAVSSAGAGNGRSFDLSKLEGSGIDLSESEWIGVYESECSCGKHQESCSD